MYEDIINAIDGKDIDYVRLFNQPTTKLYHQQDFNSAASTAAESKIVSRDDYFVNESVGGFISSIFVKSDIVKKHNVKFPMGMRTLEDQAFSLACATFADKVMVLSQPRGYYYFKGNEASVTATAKDSSNDIIRCVNIAYEAFKATGSQRIIREYFYPQYLPIKLDGLCSNRLRYKNTPLSETLLPEIKIPFRKLSLKTKIKFILAKIQRLV